MDLELIALLVLSQVPWLLWAMAHIKAHPKDGFDHVAVAEDFRRQNQRNETNIFNLTKRLRQLEDLVGKEDV